MICSVFRDSDYTKLRKELLREKGGGLQREFLEVTRYSGSFVAWIEERIRVEEGESSLSHGGGDGFAEEGRKFALLPHRLSEQEYKEAPEFVERMLYDGWRGLAPARASEETFWGYVTLEHIRKGIIDAFYLAANGGNLPGGLERIDKALAEGQEEGEQEKKIDLAVRTILRRLGGLPEARGTKSVYVNCPFARAWWRRYVAEQVCKETGADAERVARTLAQSQEYWERLIVLIVSRNSVLGDVKVRTALIWALSELVEDESKKRLFVAKILGEISRQIGIRSAWQELGVFEVDELKRIMEGEFLSRFV